MALGGARARCAPPTGGSITPSRCTCAGYPPLPLQVRVVGEADLAFDSAKGLAEQPTDAEVAAVGGGVGGGVVVVVVVGGGGGGDSGGGGRRDGRAVVEWPSHLLTHSLAPAQADDWERRLNARG